MFNRANPTCRVLSYFTMELRARDRSIIILRVSKFAVHAFSKFLKETPDRAHTSEGRGALLGDTAARGLRS